jgi:hypothetical protein
MQRAALSAIITGSLATELVEVRHAELVSSLQANAKKGRGRAPRKRARS